MTSTGIQNHAEEYADSLAETIETLMTALDEDGTVEGEHIVDYLDEYPLEIVRQVGRRFEVVLTVGGPDARAVADLDSGGDLFGSALLEVHWGGDVARRYGSAIDDFVRYYTAWGE